MGAVVAVLERLGVEDQRRRIGRGAGGRFALGRGALAEVVHRDEDGRTRDGGEQDDVDVLGHDVAYERDVPHGVAQHRQADTPDDGADEVVERVLPPRHVAHAGGDGREGAHHRHEAGQDHGDAAETLEERVRALHVLAAEDAGFLAFEDRRPCLVTDEVADLAADERGHADRQGDPPGVDPEHAVRCRGSRVRQEPRHDEQRVTGEEEADQQPRLREDDEAHHQQRPRLGVGDDGGRVQPGEQACGVDHIGPVGSEETVSWKGCPCGRGDLNPHARKHYHLKVACLPIPPPPQL